MQFNVAKLLKEGIGATRRFVLDDNFEPLEETATNHARGTIRMTRTDRGVWVSGVLEAPAWCTCSRCLAPFSISLRLPIDEEYMPTTDVVNGAPIPLSEEDAGALTIDNHHILDLTETVRQHAIINLPMKPLCREECRGICSACGVNLNDGQCRCPELARDPRWSPLVHLLSSNKI